MAGWLHISGNLWQVKRLLANTHHWVNVVWSSGLLPLVIFRACLCVYGYECGRGTHSVGDRSEPEASANFSFLFFFFCCWNTQVFQWPWPRIYAVNDSVPNTPSLSLCLWMWVCCVCGRRLMYRTCIFPICSRSRSLVISSFCSISHTIPSEFMSLLAVRKLKKAKRIGNIDWKNWNIIFLSCW